MATWPLIKCLNEMRSFLGIASYYGRFTGQFSTIAAPLYTLLEKGTEFNLRNSVMNSKYVVTLKDDLIGSQELVRKHLSTQQGKQKEYYDSLSPEVAVLQMDTCGDGFLSVRQNLHGDNYNIELFSEDDTCAKLEVRDCATGEEWHSLLTVDYIEGLSKKTGSFKRFDVFISMLQSALLQRTAALTLDLVSLEDLQILHDAKVPKVGQGERPVSSSTQDKRYLILSYTTEFDKIHYPLPLNYVGRLSAERLREVIKDLRIKLSKLYSSSGHSLPVPVEDPSLSGMQTLTLKLQAENEGLSRELAHLRSSTYPSVLNEPNGNMEVSMRANLREFVSELETELCEEKSRSSHLANQYRQDVAQLRSELNASASCQRSLYRRIQQLTNELALFKRGRNPAFSHVAYPVYSRSISADSTAARSQRSLSGHSSSHSFTHVSRPSRRDGAELPALSRKSCTGSGDHFSGQFPILERRLNYSGRPGSASPTLCRPTASPLYEGYRRSIASLRNFGRDSWVSRSQSLVVRPRANSLDRFVRSAKPPIPRFDPTAYVREKEIQRREMKLKRFAERQAQLASHLGCQNQLRPDYHACRNNGCVLVEGDSDPVCLKRHSRLSGASFSAMSSSSYESIPRPEGKRQSYRRNAQWKANRPPSLSPDPIRELVRASNSPPRRDTANKPVRRELRGKLSSDEESSFRRRQPKESNKNTRRLNGSFRNSRAPAPLNDLSNRASSRQRSSSRRSALDSEADMDESLQSVDRRTPHRKGKYIRGEANGKEPDADLDDIDRRLNILQDFFQKYLSDS
ncbi:unnamed protein product [Calicophoron daubneyi]|uniref:Coiled-coil domain-containing protein 61 n=1 Tax=Calicophoron daubneyi TaxID=300641 RepID=A0AAV2U019_CALDB